jgi:hypothetical protein
MQVVFEPDVHPRFLDDELVDASGVDGGSRCAEGAPTALLLSGARPIGSNRMWLWDRLHSVERHQDLPTEPDFDPSRTGRAWTVLASSEPAGTRLCGVPKDAQNRGQGLKRRFHVSEHARRVRRRCGRPI